MENSQHTSLFVFGTLCDEDVLRIVIGRELPSPCRRAARLTDYVRLRLHNETYPVLAPLPGGSVPGYVLTLSAPDMDRVKFFEADEYALQPARVLDVHGRLVDVVFCAQRAGWPGPRDPWSLRHWQHAHKRAFLERAHTYMALYGTMTVAQADVVWLRLSRRDSSRLGE